MPMPPVKNTVRIRYPQVTSLDRREGRRRVPASPYRSIAESSST